MACRRLRRLGEGLIQGQAGGIEIIAALPAGHGNHTQRGVQLELSVEITCQFAQGHPMAYRQWGCIYVTVFAHIRHRALHPGAPYQVRPVQDHDLGVGLRGCFEKVTDQRFVGVKTNTRIGEIDEDSVQPAQGIERWMQFRRGRPEQAHHRQAARWVGGVGNARLIEGARDAVLRAEQHLQLEPGHSRSGFVQQHIDGAVALLVDPRFDW